MLPEQLLYRGREGRGEERYVSTSLHYYVNFHKYTGIYRYILLYRIRTIEERVLFALIQVIEVVSTYNVNKTSPLIPLCTLHTYIFIRRTYKITL